MNSSNLTLGRPAQERHQKGGEHETVRQQIFRRETFRRRRARGHRHGACDCAGVRRRYILPSLPPLAAISRAATILPPAWLGLARSGAICRSTTIPAAFPAALLSQATRSWAMCSQQQYKQYRRHLHGLRQYDRRQSFLPTQHTDRHQCRRPQQGRRSRTGPMCRALTAERDDQRARPRRHDSRRMLSLARKIFAQNLTKMFPVKHLCPEEVGWRK
jgi:hypothetical protein